MRMTMRKLSLLRRARKRTTTGQMSLLRTSTTWMLAAMTLQVQDLTPATFKTKARGKPTLSAVQVSLSDCCVTRMGSHGDLL
eukprot:789475-Amphidinium_carterae.1